MFRSVPWGDANIVPFPAPSRIAFAGCWHANSGLSRNALRVAADRGATTIVHTGDFLYTGSAAERMVAAMEEEAKYLDVTIVVVRGNHDDPAIYAEAALNISTLKPADGFARLSPHVLHAPNGMRWAWQGVEFTALGGAHSVDRAARTEGVSYWEGETASGPEVDKVKRGGHTNVIVTHDIPAGADLPFGSNVPSWWDLDGAQAHREHLSTAVDATTPEWVIGGHMHFRYSGAMRTPGGTRCRVEVLNQIEQGVAENLLFANLDSGVLTPSP